MKSAWALWVLFRVLRWAFWIAFFAYSFYVVWDRPNQVTQFGHLPAATELRIFGLDFAAVICGFLELMMREKVGVPRPRFLRDWLPGDRNDLTTTSS
jgi:hypothetical protein